MSAEVIVIIVVVGVLDTTLLLLAFRKRTDDPRSFPQRPDGWDATSEGDFWNERAGKLRSEQLEHARQAAKDWGQTIAALLGVFATVAFIKGPESLDKIPGDNAYAVVAMIATAGGTAAIAVYLAAIAAQGTPSQVRNFDGWRLKNITQAEAVSVAGQLRASRVLALVAALTLLGAMGAAWLASLSTRGTPAKGETLLVVTRDGSPSCGTFARGIDGKLVLIADDDELQLDDVGQVVKVESCPEAKDDN